MHWNDKIDFEAALVRSKQAMLQRPVISTPEALYSINEVIGTVIQAIVEIGQRPDLMAYHGWLIKEFQSLQPELDQFLDKVPVVLPSARDNLLRYKVDSIKYALAFHHQPPNALFDELFLLLNEQKSLWYGMHNITGQLEAFTLILDEYSAYNHQLGYPSYFETDYKIDVLTALDEAEQLLAKTQGNLAYIHYGVGMAYYCYLFNIKKNQAKNWLDAFDKISPSLNHKALWFRDQHAQAKAWVDEVS